MKHIFHFLNKTVDFLFPYYCVGCKQAGKLVCETCQNRLFFLPSKVEDNMTTLFSYENKLIKNLLWRLKYKHSLQVVEVLGPYLADWLFSEYSDWQEMNLGSDKWILIPAPIFWHRKNQRGYNQAEKLAQFVVNSYPDCFELGTDIVKKIKSTKPQVKCKSRRERLDNLVGAFEVKLPASFACRQFIIIDDVSTTGTTIAEIQKVLKKAGAKKIKSVVVAHG